MDVSEKSARVQDMINRAYGTRYTITKASVAEVIKAIENKSGNPSDRFEKVVFEISKIHDGPSNRPIAARCYVTLGLRDELPDGALN